MADKKLLSFKDFKVDENKPGEDELVQIKDKKRRNGAIDESVEQLDEVLSTAARIKKRAIMKRMKSKIKRGLEKSKHRAASKETLKKRSNKRARAAVASKLMKKKKKDMSLADRISLEKRMVAKKSMIQRMAKKMLKDVRKDDIKRRTGK